MNCSIPVYRIEISELRKKYIKEDIENILDEQILISQLSQGITYQDTENMDSYERSYVLSKLIQMEKDKIEAKQNAIKEARNKK